MYPGSVRLHEDGVDIPTYFSESYFICFPKFCFSDIGSHIV